MGFCAFTRIRSFFIRTFPLSLITNIFGVRVCIEMVFIFELIQDSLVITLIRSLTLILSLVYLPNIPHSIYIYNKLRTHRIYDAIK